ncbi:MAG: NADH-quinone oxidoreductase subunit A, partial [Bacteroidota bacterium]|nr:NADH-quinone oxidoreductase subunit A [Bacteroidota bacterium]
EWIKAKPVIPTTDITIPALLYTKLNLEQGAYKVTAFTAEAAPLPATVTVDASAPPPIRKPMFKPTFKKPGNE